MAALSQAIAKGQFRFARLGSRQHRLHPQRAHTLLCEQKNRLPCESAARVHCPKQVSGQALKIEDESTLAAFDPG
jgi:hypothetical protein